jgi:sulfatase-modifying factor enzyme 1/caspase domain-containing protein
MRRAFVMGSNGPDSFGALKYALDDAARVKEELSSPRCAFTVTEPEANCRAPAVRQQLFEFVENCVEDDTVLCYFSGHGFLARGSLFLLWHDSNIDRLLTTTIPVSDILQALRICPAENKLLILDCCHAGTVVNMAGLKGAEHVELSDAEMKPENHLVLMASNRLEKARELEYLGGSFMTSVICSALSHDFIAADFDRDKRISVEDLRRWLEKEARRHNANHPDKRVPYPYIFGQKKGEFFLTADSSNWRPIEIPAPDGSTLIALPRYPSYGVLCIGKYPVTNAQYRRFVETTDDGAIVAPKGVRFTRSADGTPHWNKKFAPWDEPLFNKPDQPVVCVSYDDAMAYCNWIESLDEGWDHPKVSLPTAQLWDFAAFGTDFPPRDPAQWLSRTPAIHEKADSPALMDSTGRRTNAWGVSDLVGNVWEWCRGNIVGPFTKEALPLPEAERQRKDVRLNPQVRGGGYLDDIAKTEIFLSAAELPQRTNTRQSDLGFRIAAEISLSKLPPEVVKALEACPKYPDVTFEMPVLA